MHSILKWFRARLLSRSRLLMVAASLTGSAALLATIAASLTGGAAFLASGKASPSTRPQRGYTYIRDVISEIPWSVHVLKIDRNRSELSLQTVVGQYPQLGMGTVPDQVKALPPSFGRPIAAINGDFYKNARNYPGDPEGLQIMDGELLSAPNPTRVCFWVDCDGVPHRTNVLSQFQVVWPDGTAIPFGLNEERDGNAVLYTPAVGKTTHTAGGVEIILEASGQGAWLPLQVGQSYVAKVREVRSSGNSALTKDTMVLSLNSDLSQHVPTIKPGSLLKISTATLPSMKGTKTAIGGGPTLVMDGKARTWTGSQPRHPRTAIGWNKDYIFLLVVDGRQRNISVGMTFSELADYMVKLGCDEAMNLDGGGSATFYMFGNVINSPSEGKERPAANALVLFQKKADDEK